MAGETPLRGSMSCLTDRACVLREALRHDAEGSLHVLIAYPCKVLEEIQGAGDAEERHCLVWPGRRAVSGARRWEEVADRNAEYAGHGVQAAGTNAIRA